MSLIAPNKGQPIPGLNMPKDFYWVLDSPAPLAGMRLPREGLPWNNLHAAGFSQVVSLHPGAYSPTPLGLAFAEHLEDLVGGGPPRDEEAERQRVRRAVNATIQQLTSGNGVVVHCWGGRGRTGTVIGCVLRELGYSPSGIVTFLDNLHKTRGKSGWPESPWQRRLVEDWATDG